MSEYLNVHYLTAGTHIIPIPEHGINGLYASNSIDLSWKYNATLGLIESGLKKWEPMGGFHPLPTSYFVITTASDTTITVRACYDE